MVNIIVRNTILVSMMGTMIAGGWYLSTRVPAEVDSKFEAAASLGAEYESKGYYLDAINSYNEALSIRDDNSIRRAIVMDYLMMEDYKNFENAAVDYLKTEADEEIYIGLINYYFESDSKETAGKYIASAENEFPDSDAIKSLRTEFNGLFTTSFTEYTDVSEFVDGHAIAKLVTGETYYEDEGIEVYYLLNSKGKKELMNAFVEIDDVRGISEAEEDNIAGSILVTGLLEDNDKRVCLDEDGYNRAIDTDGYDYVGVEHDGKILVQSNGKWMYLTDGVAGEEYEDATAFMNGIAAVKENGKWALIDQSEELITDYAFDDIYIDSLKCCSRGGVVFAKTDDGYKLVDSSGEFVNDATYEEVKGFTSVDGVAAVKQNGKWGAIDTSGEMILNCEYEETGSSETDYIPYKDGDLWGYVNKDGVVLIEAQFDDATGINSEGYGMVFEGGYWEIITIYSIKGEESLFDM